MFRALVPSGAASLTLAPRSSRTLTVSMWPFRTAKSKGVKPAFDFAFEIGAGGEQQVGGGGVAFGRGPHQGRLAFDRVPRVLTSAPAPSSTLRASVLPVSAAVISAVSPSSEVPFGSAPALSSRSMIAALPFVAGEEERRNVVASGGLGIRAGGEQEARRSRRCRAERPNEARWSRRLPWR